MGVRMRTELVVEDEETIIRIWHVAGPLVDGATMARREVLVMKNGGMEICMTPEMAVLVADALELAAKEAKEMQD